MISLNGGARESKEQAPWGYPTARPFLRWAGGKQKLIKWLLPFLPPVAAYSRYYEPFFGAGALFFALRPIDATIADINGELMNCYTQVAKCPALVALLLQGYSIKDCREFFYEVRAREPSKMSDEERAARFVYLNKAAFNGIYRVNKSGEFNVPYGPSFKGPAIPSPQVLASAARCLRGTQMVAGDFEQVVATACDGSFVYLDPPYPPLSRTSYFTHYSADRFCWKEQLRVAHVFSELSERGCLVMLTNAEVDDVISLYREFHISSIDAIRWLGSNGDRFHVREIVVTNYEPKETIRA